MLRSAGVAHEGNPGTWFDSRVARCLLARVSLVEPLQLRVDLLTERNQERDDQMVLMRQAISTSREAQELLMLTIEMHARRALRAEAKLDHWSRSPLLWTGVGAVLIIAAEVGVALLLGAI